MYDADRYRPVLALLIFGAYWCAFRGTWSSWLFSRSFIYVIGGMCYTLYLYHFYVVSAVGNPALRWIEMRTNDLTTMVIFTFLFVLPAVVLSGAVLFALFEKPFMRRAWFEEFMRWINRDRRKSPR
jgi:peptidoglycan/LPS O-acetylase OafA/YrhL